MGEKTIEREKDRNRDKLGKKEGERDRLEVKDRKRDRSGRKRERVKH